MINKKVALITGAAGSIGSAIARRLVDSGYAIAVTDVNKQNLDKLTQELNAEGHNDIFSVAADIEQTALIETVVTNVRSKWGRIDLLVNNAAWRTRTTLKAISVEEWERTIRVCITAPAFFTKYAAVVMEQQKNGVIINVSSVQSHRAGGGSPAYTASKGALESLTYESAILYGPSGIRAVAINPGFIDTALSADFENESGEDISNVFNQAMIDQTPLQRGGKATEVAAAVQWLASDDASFITGTTITIDGGFTHNFNSYSLKKIQFPNEF